MIEKSKITNVSQFLAINLFLIASIVVTPFFSFESINLPKFVVLVFFGCIALIQIILNLKVILPKLPVISRVIVFGMLATYLFVFILSSTPWQQQLFGRENRRNGLITYLCLVLLFIIFNGISYSKYIKVFVNRIAIAGILVTSYSVIQLIGLDPFKWDSVNLHFFSTLGNPNFLSAYIAIITIPILNFIHYNLGGLNSRIKITVLLLVAVLLSYLIFRTISYQGFISLFASLSVFILITLYKLKRKVLFAFVAIFVGSGALTALIGTLNVGPLANILYKGSVTSRGDFFRAAVNSGNSNFFNGTGFDSFGDYFLLYRDDVAGSRPNGEFTDSAHNYFLDLYATQGFFGLAFYLLLTIFTLICFIRLIRNKDFEISIAVLFSSWVAVQVQSLVSPTNFLFSILIYSISGFVIGSASNLELNSKLRLNQLSVTVGCFLALLITIPPISREYLILKANQQGSPEKYIDSLDMFPKSTVSYSRAINLFAQAGLESQALTVSRDAIKFNRRTPAAHVIIFTSSQTSEEEKSNAYKILLELDPKNLKLYGLKP